MQGSASPALSGILRSLAVASRTLPSCTTQVEHAKQAQEPIRVVLPDGSEQAGVRGVTTPMEVIKGISKSLANSAVVAKVDGHVWDLFRPLEGDCALQVHGFDDPEGKEVRAAPSE